MHPACKNFYEGLKNKSANIELKCNIHLLEEDCLKQHVTDIVIDIELKQRQALIDDVTAMFPQVDKKAISQNVYNVPVHINARYAILNAVLNKKNGCHCPEFNLLPLQTISEELRDEHFIENNYIINENDFIDLTFNYDSSVKVTKEENLSSDEGIIEPYVPVNNLMNLPNETITRDPMESVNNLKQENVKSLEIPQSYTGISKYPETNNTDEDDTNELCTDIQEIQQEYYEDENHKLHLIKTRALQPITSLNYLQLKPKIRISDDLSQPGPSGLNNNLQLQEFPINPYPPVFLLPRRETDLTQPGSSGFFKRKLRPDLWPVPFNEPNDIYSNTIIDITDVDVPKPDNEVEVISEPGNYTNLRSPNKHKRRQTIDKEHSLKAKLLRSTSDTGFVSVVGKESCETNPTIASTITKDERKLINALAEIFPDCDMTYLENICRENSFNSNNVVFFTDKLLGEDYPRKNEHDTDPIDYDLQLDIMMGVLPDADPDYLTSELNKMNTNEELKMFMSNCIENRSYPKAADVAKRRQMHAQTRQYTEDFDPEQFLNIIPNPESYFTDENFKAGVIKCNSPSYGYMLTFLRNHFNKVSMKQITRVLGSSKTLLQAVETLSNTKEGILHSKRKVVSFPDCNHDIPLLQLFAYIKNKEYIEVAQSINILAAQGRKRQAIEKNEVKTCACCYDDEVIPEDAFTCPNGCTFCKDCIKRAVEIRFAENNLDFPCLADCTAHFSLDTLQACVSPKVFCKLAKRKQLEEVRAAGIDDLEICPFCDFAAIPAAEDKIFKCFNPDCMKESCRACKEPSHIPLRCDEVEKDADVKQRTYIEDQMTEALMRKCWKCNLKFIKSDGCNKISCKCGATMCYVCNTPKVDYKHFNGQGANSPGKCPLYSNTELLHENNAIQGGQQAKIALGITSLKVDPLADAKTRLEKALKQYKPLPGAQI